MNIRHVYRGVFMYYNDRTGAFQCITAHQRYNSIQYYNGKKTMISPLYSVLFLLFFFLFYVILQHRASCNRSQPSVCAAHTKMRNFLLILKCSRAQKDQIVCEI